ncbi:MAG: TatD family hydrolase, partial [Eggerthellaceae bacterium]|nr:TatD family hydrolase [Eggerthellaceae bacterium]
VLEQAISLVESTRFIGEIGLDFGRRGAQSASAQVPVFKEIMTHAARQGGKVISIHAIKSADTVLNVLETSGALDTCACIMHWFSGTSQDLDRARKDGCLFSVNPMMVQSRRGREYVRQIPSGQLLLETDAPPGENVPFAYDQLAAALSNTQREIKAIKQHR